MLDTLDAKRFCSGHSEVLERDQIRKHIDQMKQRQAKVEKLIAEGKSNEQIKGEFPESEARLIDAIVSEIQKQ